MRISLADLMSRYTPPVPQSQYHVSFVPVVCVSRDEGGDSGVSLDGSEEDSSPSSASSSSLGGCIGGLRMKGHLLRTCKACWCDKAARELILQVSVSHPQGVCWLIVSHFNRCVCVCVCVCVYILSAFNCVHCTVCRVWLLPTM